MRSFFTKEQTDKTVCSRPIEYSRSYEKGKSFHCTEYQRGVDYYNNDFLQDFVIYDYKLYACVRDTIEVPGESED